MKNPPATQKKAFFEDEDEDEDESFKPVPKPVN